jgi:hypothetical protein
MKSERKWWYRVGTPALGILSAFGLFKAAGILPFASIAAWMIFLICAYGLERLSGFLFDVIATIVDAKSRQLARRRRAGSA